MDYRTKPLSREKIREISVDIRKLFGYVEEPIFDVIAVFEVLPLFNNVSTEIVCDNNPELGKAPATTVLCGDGTYCIKVKEKVYDGACEGNGGYRMHIMHEMCHYFLFSIGYTPFIDRSYKNKDLKSYESIEWQAKALAGEILIPYEKSKNMSAEEIVDTFNVSRDAAINRINIDKKKVNNDANN